MGVARTPGRPPGYHAPVDPQRLLALLRDLLDRTGPAAPLLLFLASFIEYVFPPFPGDAMVVLGAWYATHGMLSWPTTFAAVTLGALVGATVDWRLGRWLGARLEARASLPGNALDRAKLERFEAAYRKWGGLFLVANRFLPGIRAFFFLAAGASHIPLWEVLLFGGISAALWNALLLGVGAFMARNLEEMVGLFERYTSWATAAVALAALAAVAAWLWRRRAGKRK
jgi:membrane protein DedA with SNARE-associated domain